VVEARRPIITQGRERWAQRTKDLASALQKSVDTVACFQRDGAYSVPGTDVRGTRDSLEKGIPIPDGGT